MKRLGLIISLVLVTVTGCSNQYREAEEIEMQELLTALQAVEQASSLGATSSLVQEILKLQEDPDTYIFYSYGPGPLGPPASVASLLSFDAFGFDGEPFDFLSLDQVQVFFFDTYKTTGRQYAMILGVKRFSDSSMKYVGMTGTGDVSDTQFAAELSGVAGTITLRSNDIEDGELSTVIQLRVYQNIGGAEQYIGKFSTLVGFQP